MDPDEFGLFAAPRGGPRHRRGGAGECGRLHRRADPGRLGGVIIPPASYWPEVEKICRERDVLLVCDEVDLRLRPHGGMVWQPAYGRSFDLVTFAKGITSGYFPLGGEIVGDKVAEGFTGGTAEISTTATPIPAIPAAARRPSPTSGSCMRKAGGAREARHRPLPQGALAEARGTPGGRGAHGGLLPSARWS